MQARVKNQRPFFSTFISTNISGARVFIASMRYTKYFRKNQILFSIPETMQVSSAIEQPIFDTLFGMLEFIYKTVVLSHNERIISECYGEVVSTQNVEQRLLQRIEFIPTVFL